MKKAALPAVIAVIVVALIVLVYSIVNTAYSKTAAPTPPGKPQVNDARTRALYMRTHGGAPMPGSTSGQVPGGR